MELEKDLSNLSIKDIEDTENSYRAAVYEGEIIYCSTPKDIEEASKDLLENFKNIELNVGFNIEWRVTYKIGPIKVDLIQVSPRLNICYLFHVTGLKHLPDYLVKFLAQSTITLTGVNIKTDITRLGNAFNIHKNLVTSMKNNCVDSGTLANEICNKNRKWSMKDLAKEYLNIDVDKDQTVRISNWNIMPLSEEQKKYAAIDSYISLILYSVLSDELLHNRVLDISLGEEETDRQCLPLLEYTGDITYCKTSEEYEKSCKKIITLTENTDLVLGFDLKAKKEKVYIIQLSPSIYECFIFTTFGYNVLPEVFVDLLTHPRVSLAAFSANTKIKKIKKAFPLLYQHKINTIDLGTMHIENIGEGDCTQPALLGRMLDCRIPQSPKTLEWNVSEHSKSQLKFAATEAFVALKLHNNLKEMKRSGNSAANSTINFHF